jgi:hypothetical protein
MEVQTAAHTGWSSCLLTCGSCVPLLRAVAQLLRQKLQQVHHSLQTLHGMQAMVDRSRLGVWDMEGKDEGNIAVFRQRQCAR